MPVALVKFPGPKTGDETCTRSGEIEERQKPFPGRIKIENKEGEEEEDEDKEDDDDKIFLVSPTLPPPPPPLPPPPSPPPPSPPSPLPIGGGIPRNRTPHTPPYHHPNPPPKHPENAGKFFRPQYSKGGNPPVWKGDFRPSGYRITIRNTPFTKRTNFENTFSNITNFEITFSNKDANVVQNKHRGGKNNLQREGGEKEKEEKLAKRLPEPITTNAKGKGTSGHRDISSRGSSLLARERWPGKWFSNLSGGPAR
ncbi:protein TonB-like [Macrobrachium nipponense]|uniref:protein TonB-like n=1 Tax=Macrobrachium nipponense TaxID=159736 RepID=UPI0030C83BF4